MFRKHNLKFRERLKKILPLKDIEDYYDKTSGETVIYRSLEETDSLDNFAAALTGIIEMLTAALVIDGSFQTPSEQE